MKNPEELNILFAKYLSNECSLEEAQQLMGHFHIPEDSEHLKDLIIDSLEQDEDRFYNSIVTEVVAKVDVDLFDQIRSISPVAAMPRRIRMWPRIAIAAAVLVVVFGAGLFFYNSQQKTEPSSLIANDIAPGKNGATLTLASGQKILIRDALAGNIAVQSGVKISKTADGQIVYEITNDNSGEIAYNTLSTTRGEQTQVRLPDGTLVFLNAESSLRYPTSFAKLDKRQVSLTGEGYFEVAKDKVHPFVVSAKDQHVEVLGTHFNINSYTDEAAIRTTLLEGSVKVSSARSKTSALLRPNQQAVSANGDVKVVEVDGEDAVAWKNGLFIFEDEPLESIMKSVERWYDVEVVYESGVDKTKKYWGSVSRYDKVSKVLQNMELTKNIHFKIEGRRITVMK